MNDDHGPEWFAAKRYGLGSSLPISWQGWVVLLVFIAGVWSGGIAERHYGGTDPGAVVIDEVLGMLITLLLNPVGWTGALGGFLLFRIFDVIKPYPANRLERLQGIRPT